MTYLPPASRRICLVLDVEKYSNRGNVNHLAIQRHLRKIAEGAIGHARLYWNDIEVQDQGDGLLLQLPPDVDEPRVIPGLVAGHCLAVRQANMRAMSGQQIRLRMALTQGIRHLGETGKVGDAVIAACRLVGCQELRAAFGRYPNRDVGLIVADDLYRDVIAHGYPGLDSATFSRVQVRVADKDFTELAWTHIPEPPYGTLQAAPRDTRAVYAAGVAAGVAGAGAIVGGIAVAAAHHHADTHAADPHGPGSQSGDSHSAGTDGEDAHATHHHVTDPHAVDPDASGPDSHQADVPLDAQQGDGGYDTYYH